MYKKLNLALVIASCLGLSACGGGSSEQATPTPVTSNHAPSISASINAFDTFGRHSLNIVINSSDLDNDPLSFSWSQVSPTEITLDLSQIDSEGNLSLTLPDVSEETEFKLRAEVSDGDLSASDIVTINVKKANPDPLALISGRSTIAKVTNWPVANIQNVTILKTTGTIGLNPSWVIKDFPDNSLYTLTSSDSTITGFYADTEGTYTIGLQIDNDQGLTHNAEFKINVISDIDGDGTLDGDDQDTDGDGYAGADDLFDADKASHSDTDGDGISNYHQDDEDGDGVNDHEDKYPFDDQKTALTNYQEPSETNSNDGISVAEIVNAMPVNISGELSSNGGYDQDYYRLSLIQGRVTINVVTSDNSQPILSLVNNIGQQIPYIDVALTGNTVNGAINGIIADDGDYYLVVANRIDSSVTYELNVYYDADQDGLSDDLEAAIDSNPHSIDSDNDGLSDGIEYFGIPQGSYDSDNDGIPAWWDLDTDGDLIADSLEVASNRSADVDEDGLINSADTDSDNNGISDTEEAGFNIYQPRDTDFDGVPDYLDLDNDGDLIDDLIDVRPTTPIEISVLSRDPSEALNVSSITLEDSSTTNQCKQKDKITINVENVSENTALYLIFAQGSEYSEISYERVGSALTVECGESMLGAYNIIVSDGDVRSEDYGLTVVHENIMTLDKVDVSGSYLTFEGSGYNQPLTVHYPESTIDIANSEWSNETSLSVYIPSEFTGGTVYLSSALGQTDQVHINIKRSDSVNVTIEAVTGMANESLVIMSSDENDISLADGSARTETDARNPEVIAILTYKDNTPYVVGYAPVLPSMNNIEVNSATTAIGYLWPTIRYDWNLANADSVLTSLYALDEVKALGKVIYDGLANDIGFMVSSDIYTSDEYKKAIDAIAASLPAITSRAAVGPVVKPEGELDDIMVKLVDNEIVIENDTMLHLAYQMTSPSGTILCSYGTGFWSNDYIGAQSTFWKIATVAPACKPAQNAKIRILTAGVDNEHDAKLAPTQVSLLEQEIRKNLAGRAIIDGVIVPVMMELLDQAGATSVKGKTVRNIIYKEAPWILTEAAEFTSGGQDFDTFKKNVITKLGNDVRTYGPLTKTLFEAIFKDKVTDVITKLATKTAAKFVPILGQLYAAWDYSGLVFAGVDIGKTITDLASTDTVIDFTVEYPLRLESVMPSIVNTDGLPKTFNLYGSGFTAVDPGFFSAEVPPTVVFTNKKTNESVELNPEFISNTGVQLRVTVNGDFFLEEGTEYSIQVKQSENKLESEILDPGVQVESSLTLESLSPGDASVNDIVRITGSGFSTNTNDNTLMFGDDELAVLTATSTELAFRIPFNVTAGSYDIKVKRGDITDSDWSNSLTLVISDSAITIRVCDDGSAKDDNFALDVNGVRIGQTYTSNSQYCFTFPVTVSTGVNTAVLTGLDAPDGIGTYSIDFYGVDSITGARQSGSDLVPGSAPKVYNFTVSEDTTRVNNTVQGVRAISLAIPVQRKEI